MKNLLYRSFLAFSLFVPVISFGMNAKSGDKRSASSVLGQQDYVKKQKNVPSNQSSTLAGVLSAVSSSSSAVAATNVNTVPVLTLQQQQQELMAHSRPIVAGPSAEALLLLSSNEKVLYFLSPTDKKIAITQETVSRLMSGKFEFESGVKSSIEKTSNLQDLQVITKNNLHNVSTMMELSRRHNEFIQKQKNDLELKQKNIAHNLLKLIEVQKNVPQLVEDRAKKIMDEQKKVSQGLNAQVSWSWSEVSSVSFFQPNSLK